MSARPRDDPVTNLAYGLRERRSTRNTSHSRPRTVIGSFSRVSDRRVRVGRRSPRLAGCRPARFAEQAAGVRGILAACALPVLVDADDGYADAKNVTHTITSYEAMGVSAVFIEDQVSKRC